MPCGDDRYRINGEDSAALEFTKKQGHAATKAACELAKIIKHFNLQQYVSWETQQWMLAHDQEDNERRYREAAERYKKQQEGGE